MSLVQGKRVCVSSAQERGGGGERQRERERERERESSTIRANAS